MGLTKLTCDSAKCPEGRTFVRLADDRGLYLEVTAKGGRYWRWKYRYAGKEKRLALGTYPEISLKTARDQRDQARALLASGTDPGAAKQEAKRAQLVAPDLTFEAVARAWWDKWRIGRSERHAGYVIRRLESHIFPVIGHKAIADLTAGQFIEVAVKIESTGAKDVARRSLQMCGQVMRHAIVRDLVDRNPLDGVKPSDGLASKAGANNFARVDESELPHLLRAIDAYQGTPMTRLAMKLMALTFVRTGELINATWDEIDLDARTWRIPPGRMKMRTPHIVPLSDQAVEALLVLKTATGSQAHLFPGERDRSAPISNGTILGALKRMGYAGRMTGHGFRGVASTVLHEHGFAHELIELQLAHQKRDAVSAAYNHALHLAERRKMMQWWATRLDTLRASAK